MAEQLVDAKDLVLLRALDENARYSISELARKTKINKETVKYRLNRLKEKNILTGFWLIPSSELGFSVHKILIRNKGLGNTEELIDFLQQDAVSWFATTQGGWDLIITTFTKSQGDFSLFYNQLLEKFGRYFESQILLISDKIIEMNEKYLYPNNNLKYSVEQNFSLNGMCLDKKDELLLHELSGDGRISFVDLSKKIDLTAEAIASRFRNLKKKGTIRKIKPRINFRLLGYDYYHIFVDLTDYSKKEKLVTYYLKHPYCISMMNHLGRYQLHFELIIPPNEISSVVSDLRSRFGESIRSVEVLEILKEHRIKII